MSSRVALEGRQILIDGRQCFLRSAEIHYFRLARGDGIRFTGAQRRETGWGLDKGSTIEVVQRIPRLG